MNAPTAYRPSWWQLDEGDEINGIEITDTLSHLRSRLHALGDVLASVGHGGMGHATAQNIGHVVQDYCDQLRAFEGEVQRRVRKGLAVD